MADEAFALSPISARAALPSEEDYDAISQAFMETSRGRWFLGEYAKRNRNADTRMVLDAVERIEQTIVAQGQSAAESGLTEALSAIRHAVNEAEAAAAVAVENLAADENLAPIRKGARIIREISWRWREIGADGRICDLLDSQVSAIEGACGQVAAVSPQEALSAAFDLIRERLAEFGDNDKPSPQATEKSFQSASPAMQDEARAVVVEPPQAAGAFEEPEAAIAMADAKMEMVEAVETTAEAGDETLESAEPYDEALLDMVALEMAAPDPGDLDDGFDAAGEAPAAAPPPAEPVLVAERTEPIAAPAEPRPAPPSPQPSLQDSLRPSVQASPQPSLGSSLLAHGIVRKPVTSASDPLAPIRRMSQAEKIAFFS
ncbi:MAG TPA: hypothetical protein VN065_18195 [Bradyrhizobium sp.]|nr:hypothetical protein [Bradyrhizobium sp.]